MDSSRRLRGLAAWFRFVFLAALAAHLTTAAVSAQIVGRVPGTNQPGGDRVMRGIDRFGRLLGASSDAGSTWQVWWKLNKDFYLGLARRDEVNDGEDSGGMRPFLGRHVRRIPSKRPFGGDVRIRIIRPDLELVLQDEKIMVRRAAALALGLLGDPESAEPLQRAVADSNTGVQDTAILSLGMLRGGGSSVPFLAALLAGGPETAKLVNRDRVNDQLRATAALALGLTGHATALQPLIRATARKEPRNVRAAAARGLGFLDDPGAEARLIRMLGRKNTGVAVRAVAAGALAGHGGPEACAALLTAVKDGNTEVRRSAALGLGQVRMQTPAIDRLETAVRRRRDVKGATAEVIVKLDAIIEETREPAEKERALQKKFNDARRRALRAAATDDPEFVVRQFALLALGQVGEQVDRGLLIDALRDDAKLVRPAAAIALGILGRRGGDPDGKIGRGLHTEFRKEARLDYRVAFAVALGLRGWREAGEDLLKAMRGTENTFQRSYYAVALAFMGHAEALPDIVSTMRKSRQAFEAQQAAMAYGLLANRASARALREMLQSSGSRFDRQAAAVGLALYGKNEDLRLLSRYIRGARVPAIDRAVVIEGIGVAGDARDPGPLAWVAGGYNFYLSFESIDRAISRKW